MPSGINKVYEAMSRVGEKIGIVTIIKYIGPNHHRKTIYQCKCDCGKVFENIYPSIKKMKSCGCLGKKAQSQSKIIHGHCVRSKKQTQIYSTWKAMNKRCSNKNSVDYQWYGGRGISVCDRWKVFTNFLEDMEKTFFENASIDRIDSDGNYEKSNCRWLSRSENARNAALNRWNKERNR